MSSALARFQQSLAAYLRAPEDAAAPPGLDARAVEVYRQLHFNNINALLATNFPVIQRTLGSTVWRALVRGFCQHHRASSPLFTEIGQEFIAFLDQGSAPALPGWINELAHYEWIELELQLCPARVRPIDSADPLQQRLVLSPLVRLLGYQWPVHRIGPQWQPSAAPPHPTLLLASRDAVGQVQFAELSPLVFRLLEHLEAEPGIVGHRLLTQLAAEAGVPASETFVDEAAALLQRLQQQGRIHHAE